ncbi:MAG: DUF4173 domain-containing protein, partial [Pyrinomonadaceae bacterium]
MTDRTKMGIAVVEAALVLGILGDAMLRATPWGLNLFIFVIGTIAALVMLNTRWRAKSVRVYDSWLYVPLLIFSLGFAWRDSIALHFFDLMGILTVLALLTLRAAGLNLLRTSLSRYVFVHATALLNGMFGPFMLLISDIKWANLPKNGFTKHLMAVVRGLLIVAPLLLIFGVLLMAADAVFAGIIKQTLHIEFPTLFGHLFLAGFIAWIAGGFLRGVVLGGAAEFAWKTRSATAGMTILNRPESGPLSLDLSKASVTVDAEDPKTDDPSDPVKDTPPAVEPSPPFGKLALGAVEVSIVVGLLNVLFLCFVIVQVRYLFGGAAMIQSTAGMSYAEYARHGFFELVAVAILVLPILLAVHWLLPKEDARLARLFRVLAGVQILLLFVIMASAMKRMLMYQGAYGMTELRLYTTAMMGWLALVFVWFSLSVLRGHRERFIGGAAIAGFAILFLLHAINPDGLIVRYNTSSARSGPAVDIYYLTRLSKDAMPDLLTVMPAMTHTDRCLVAGELLHRSSLELPTDWRSWNWSRSVARRQLHAAESQIETFGCPEMGPGGQSTPIPD